MMDKDTLKVIGIVIAVIVINVVLWKIGMPTRWQIVFGR